MLEGWNTVRFIKTINYTETKEKAINEMSLGEFWLETCCADIKLQCLVDTGSPPRFITKSNADLLTTRLGRNLL